MIMVTHNEEIARMADRIVRIKDGVVLVLRKMNILVLRMSWNGKGA